MIIFDNDPEDPDVKKLKKSIKMGEEELKKEFMNFILKKNRRN